MKKPLDFWGRVRKMTPEKITTITCPKCETEIIYLPPDHGYVVIDEVRYLVPQAVCELLQQVSEERDKLREKIGKKDEEIAALKTERESHAWEISPAMAQAKIDELNNAQIILRLSKIQQADNEKKATLFVCFEEKIAAMKGKIDEMDR